MAAHPPAWQRAARTLQRAVPTLHAVIVHGPAGRGETLPGISLDVLAVTRTETGTREARDAQVVLERALPVEHISLALLPSYRVGWLQPSVFQQSLVTGAATVWGDPGVVSVIPCWRPEHIDPRAALGEMERAGALLTEGRPAFAAVRAAGALLIARRRYEPRLERLPGALRAAWPEAPLLPPEPDGDTALAYVRDAAERLDDWLFTWEGAGPPPGARRAYHGLLKEMYVRSD